MPQTTEQPGKADTTDAGPLDASVEELLKTVEQNTEEVARTLAEPGAEPAAAANPQPKSIDEGVTAALKDASETMKSPEAGAPASVEALDAKLAAKAVAATADEFDDPEALGAAASDSSVPSASGAIEGSPDRAGEPGAQVQPAPSSAPAGTAEASGTKAPAAAKAPEKAPEKAPAKPMVGAPAPANPEEPAASEPGGLAVLAGRLANLPASTRQTLGWVAVGTFFWAGVVWVFAMFFMGPPKLPPADPRLARELVGAPGHMGSPANPGAKDGTAGDGHAGGSGAAAHGAAGAAGQDDDGHH